MTLQTFYLGTWLGMVGLTLFLSGVASLTWHLHLALAGFASVWALVGGWRRWKRFRPSPLGVTLVCVGLGVVGFLLALDAQDWVGGLSALLWSILPLFLFRGQRVYGHWLGLFTVAAISLISVMIKEELIPFSAFLLFITLLVLNLNATNLRQLAGNQGARRYRLPKRYLWGLIPALFWGGVTAALIFFLFPRTGNWSNPLALRGEDSITGYRGTVSLESATRLRESERVEMQVVSADPLWLATRVNTLYFRGNTVESFDGKDWTPIEGNWNPIFPNTDLRYTKRHTPQSQSLEIFRQQHRERSVIYPGVLGTVQVPWTFTRGLLTDGTGNIRRSRTGNIRYAYQVSVSQPLPPRSLPLRSVRAQASRFVANPNPYLQVPRGVTAGPFWKEWMAGFPLAEWDVLPLHEVFRQINARFQREFEPALIHEFRQAVPLEGFLESKQGHCEYFATVAALTLRSLGIPTRLVLGFRGGTYNTVSETVEVRAKNAHAWVEVLSGAGEWSTLDPTPGLMLGGQGGWRETWTQYSHAAAFWFNRYVVQYNLDTQRDLFRTFSRLGRRPGQPLSWSTIWKSGVWCLLFGLLVGAWRRWTPPWKRRQDDVPSYYRDFLRWTRGRGWNRRPGESLRAFHGRVAETEGDRIWIIDQEIHRDHYSPKKNSEGEKIRLRQWIKEWS